MFKRKFMFFYDRLFLSSDFPILIGGIIILAVVQIEPLPFYESSLLTQQCLISLMQKLMRKETDDSETSVKPSSWLVTMFLDKT